MNRKVMAKPNQIQHTIGRKSGIKNYKIDDATHCLMHLEKYIFEKYPAQSYYIHMSHATGTVTTNRVIIAFTA